MSQMENSFNVIMLYLYDINFSFIKLINHIKRKVEPELSNYIKGFEYSGYHQYIQETSIKQLQDIININSYKTRRFRLRLIHSQIFCGLRKMKLENVEDFYKLLICIEQNSITFLENYFNNLPYSSFRQLLNRIIMEKKLNIERFSSYKSA